MAYNKYKNKKVKVDGINFASMKEARRYKELKLLERGGAITDLVLQPQFLLIPTIRREGETLKRISYFADFKYYDCNKKRTVVEDVKSVATKTKVYQLKKRLFLLKYGDEYEFLEIM
nr:MAG TPA_asm: Endonuclease [Caudoviricetes sp.]